MKKPRAANAIALVSALVILSGCASAPVAKDAEAQPDSVTAVLLSQQDLKAKFSWSLEQNPFMPHVGTITRTDYDYVVVKLSIVTNSGAEVELLQAEVDDANNKIKAYFYDRKDFADYACSILMSKNEAIAAKRRNVVNWYYLPSRSLKLKHGKHEYIMVFMGKHPLPDDVFAYIRVMVNGEEHEFSLDVPNVVQ